MIDVLRNAGLKLNPANCAWAQEDVKYLGRRFSGTGYTTDEKVTEAVRTYPVPSDARQTKAFLGLAGYYRKFVRSYVELVAHAKD